MNQKKILNRYHLGYKTNIHHERVLHQQIVLQRLDLIHNKDKQLKSYEQRSLASVQDEEEGLAFIEFTNP